MAAIQPPGFFGKVPARGDFLARRVPAGFDAAWEDWLAGLVVAARDALGPAWPEDWLTAPLWHFSLGSGVLAPAGGAGVLVASADRVGRLFPFTILGAAAGGEDASPAAAAEFRAEWAAAAEGLMMGALEDGFEPDALDAALQALGPPRVFNGPGYRSGQWVLEMDGDRPVEDDPLSEAVRQAPGPDQSVWWCRGSDRVAPMHFRCAGLPGPLTSAQMVAGGFEYSDR